MKTLANKTFFSGDDIVTIFCCHRLQVFRPLYFEITLNIRPLHLMLLVRVFVGRRVFLQSANQDRLLVSAFQRRSSFSLSPRSARCEQHLESGLFQVTHCDAVRDRQSLYRLQIDFLPRCTASKDFSLAGENGSAASSCTFKA